MSSKYSESGVDIDAAADALKGIGNLIRSTWGDEVLSEVGNFGGLFEISSRYRQPVLVSSVDGVGTKLRVAFMSGKHDTIGEDLVNHCENDILVQGAEPLFFLDYFGCGKLEKRIIEDVVRGLARGCRANGCALIGGETAEMPGFYAEGEYDLAGSIVGVVERADLIDGSRIREGDSVWAFPSSGLHTNGYSLARKIIFEEAGLAVGDQIPGTGKSVAENLLEVHRSYLPEIRILRKSADIRGLAHITGGGLVDNIPRILPDGCGIEIDSGKWEVPPLFAYLRDRGEVDEGEMYRVFNLGVGMIMVIPAQDEEKISAEGLRWEPFPVGTVVKGERKVHIR